MSQKQNRNAQLLTGILIAAIAAFLAARLDLSVTDASPLAFVEQRTENAERETEIASMSDESVEALLMRRLGNQ